MFTIEVMQIKYKDFKMSVRESARLRGAVSSKFPAHTLLHHHVGPNRLLYHYPLIQYKVIKGRPIIIGVEKGIMVLTDIYQDIGKLHFHNTKKTDIESEISIEKTNKAFGICDSLIEYHFLTPWLGLNQKNHKTYLSVDNLQREKLLVSIIIGNILSLSKAVNYNVQEKIYGYLNLSPCRVKFKNKIMIGFKGRFLVNFNLPDLLGIGKSVARGFGTIEENKNPTEIITRQSMRTF